MLRQVKFLFGAVVVVSLATTTYIVPVITEQAIATGEPRTLATIGEPVRAMPARSVESAPPLPVRVINSADDARRIAALSAAMQDRANRLLVETGEAPGNVVADEANTPRLGTITCLAGCN